MCQNGVPPPPQPPAGVVVVKTEGGGGGGGVVPQSVALPAVPLPESVVRSLAGVPPLSTPGAHFNVPTSQLAPKPALASSQPAAKPLYRPFTLSPPPPAAASTPVAAPHHPPPPIQSTHSHHPAYRGPSGLLPQFGHAPGVPASGNPYFPYPPPPPSHHPGGFGHHHNNPFFPGGGGPPPGSTYNGLLPPRTTTPSATGTYTVAASHQDLTCRSHLPKLAHALTTTGPPPPTSYVSPLAKTTGPPPAPTNSRPDPTALRRELDSRFLASHDRNLAGAIGPPHYMVPDHANPLASSTLPPPAPNLPPPPGSKPATTSFLASSLVCIKLKCAALKVPNYEFLIFLKAKDVPKMGGPNSLFAGLENPPGFPGIPQLGQDPLRTSTASATTPAAPFAPQQPQQSQQSSATPSRVSKTF